jgi:hypothetical protein
MLEWNLGKWYFTVQCEQCHREIAFLQDASGGCMAFNPPSNDLLFTVVCPYCGCEGSYSSDQTRSVKATATRLGGKN